MNDDDFYDDVDRELGYRSAFDDDEDREYDDDMTGQDEELIDGVGFARPGSALRAATRNNPRDQPCPTCKTKNVLTRLDKARGYQCDSCADRAERGYDY
jgi:hypothetical protein